MLFPIEYFINQPLGTNVLHVQFEAGAPEQWDVQLGALFAVETSLDAVVDENHQACCNNDTGFCVSGSVIVGCLG